MDIEQHCSVVLGFDWQFIIACYNNQFFAFWVYIFETYWHWTILTTITNLTDFQDNPFHVKIETLLSSFTEWMISLGKISLLVRLFKLNTFWAFQIIRSMLHGKTHWKEFQTDAYLMLAQVRALVWNPALESPRGKIVRTVFLSWAKTSYSSSIISCKSGSLFVSQKLTDSGDIPWARALNISFWSILTQPFEFVWPHFPQALIWEFFR